MAIFPPTAATATLAAVVSSANSGTDGVAIVVLEPVISPLVPKTGCTTTVLFHLIRNVRPVPIRAMHTTCNAMFPFKACFSLFISFQDKHFP